MTVTQITAPWADLWRRRLSREPPETQFRPGQGILRGDHDLQPDKTPFGVPEQAKAAAVLIPVIARPAPTLLLTRRSAALSVHAGQIAFPGGRLDPGETALDAALREAQEEIGLNRAQATPIGYLDAYHSATGYRITPVVAVIDPAYVLTLNPAEVDEAFEAPLDFLLDPANHQLHAREWHGTVRYFYAMAQPDRLIWGVTAGIIRNLYERLRD